MPLADYLAGTLLLALMLACVGSATVLVLRRRLRHLDRLEQALAGVVIATATLLVIHLVPLILGVMSRGTVLAAGALAVLAARRVRPAAAGSSAPVAGARPASGARSWALAVVAGVVALATGAWHLREWAPRELIGVDPLTFHLPNVARWIESGSLWQIDQFIPLLAHGNYPNSGDVVLLSVVLPYHNDFLARWAILGFLVITAVAVAAIARELRAPPAAAILAGLVIPTLPVVGLASISRALPDAVLYATFAIGLLFLLRHARTDRRSDLVVAATGLGIALGVKWYGLPSVAIVIAGWAVARLAARRPLGLVVRDAALASGVVGLLGGVWLVRNLVESGNPIFPVKIAPLGVTIFDAPHDALREQVGFSVADYLGDPDVLFGELASQIVVGLGLALPVLGAALLVAFVAGGGRIDRRVLVLGVGALTLIASYAVTPYTAIGLPGEPSLAGVNTRYAVPALIAAAPVAAWAAGRLGRAGILVELALAVAVVADAREAFTPASAGTAARAAIVLAFAGAGVWVLWRLAASRGRHPLRFAAGVAAAVLVALTGGYEVQQRINDDRYVGMDPAVDVIVRSAPEERRIALAGNWSVEGVSPIWPSFGTRIANEVEFVGPFIDGFLRHYQTPGSFLAALRRGDYDLLVVGRGVRPPVTARAERWARGAGWREKAQSERLTVLVPPA